MPETSDFAGIKTELLQLIYLKLLQILHTDSFTTSICFTKDSGVISSLFLQLLLASQNQLNSLVLISPSYTNMKLRICKPDTTNLLLEHNAEHSWDKTM